MNEILRRVSLDNAAILIDQRDKEAIWKLFQRMGFTLHPLGRQSGPTSEGRSGSHGSGSRTANFRIGGYFEFLGMEEPHLPAGTYPERLAAIGSHMAKVTIAVPDPVATCNELARIGESVGSPDRYTRVFTREDGSRHECGFSLFRYPPDRTMNLQLTGGLHLTRNVTWQPDLLDHENGTVIIAAAGMISTDPERLRAGMAKVLGLGEEDYTEYGLRLPDRTQLEIRPPEHYAWTQREFPLVDGAFYTEVVFGVKSLGETKARLREGKVAYTNDGDSISIDLTGLTRLVCRFREWS